VLKWTEGEDFIAQGKEIRLTHDRYGRVYSNKTYRDLIAGWLDDRVNYSFDPVGVTIDALFLYVMLNEDTRFSYHALSPLSICERILTIKGYRLI
jgi:hypothetical protein